jgi:Na+/proline symporter
LRTLDWTVLISTVVAIVAYGVYKTRGVNTVDSYIKGDGGARWLTIALSIMATQASAVTFLSLPGQAYEDGMGFLQFYFGLPIAMVILSAVIVPIYYRLRVYTAYEYLERRFDRKTRQLTAALFLVSRGLAVGLSIYAPAIVLSTVLGWPLRLTVLGIGGLAVAYTVSGGTRAINQTQMGQMTVMLGGMGVAFLVILGKLPRAVSFGDALAIAGALGKLKIVDLSVRVDTRYTLWSGLTGGLFVALAYFGTDQSQVQRYLSGSSLAESRLGLICNGLIKVPMQFFILLVGVVVLVFYQFHPPPLFFDAGARARLEAGPARAQLVGLERAFADAFADKRRAVDELLSARHAPALDGSATRGAVAHLRAAETHSRAVLSRARELSAREAGTAKDQDYIFITFVTQHFPVGLVGLLLAVILCAALSATASALNALGATTVVDFYRPLHPHATDAEALTVAKLATAGWGIVGVIFAASAALFDNLIQAVNVLGSLFYGPMLGVFLVGFFFPSVTANGAFVATLAAQVLVVAVAAAGWVGYLWYNVIGCAAVVGLALAMGRRRGHAAPILK